MTEDRGQRTEDSGQMTGGRKKIAEARNQR